MSSLSDKGEMNDCIKLSSGVEDEDEYKDDYVSR